MLLCLLGFVLGQQIHGQGAVVQHIILRKQVKILKHHAKVQALAAQLFIAEFVRVIVVEQNLTAHRNSALLGQLQIVHAAQQRGFAAAAGTDDGKHFAFFQAEINAFEHFGAAKGLADVTNL